jgi:hypothetical protein
MPVRETQRADAPTPEVAESEARESGAASTGTQNGATPRWVLPVLVVLALVLAVVNIVMFDGSSGGWILIAGMVLLLIGASIALNPRRGSIPGGASDRYRR